MGFGVYDLLLQNLFVDYSELSRLASPCDVHPPCQSDVENVE